MRLTYSTRRKPAKRLRLVAVTVAVLATILPALSQRKPNPGPRAMGVLVIPKATPGQKTPPPYLIPITLWYQGRFFDAQLYGARPEPMALDGGVVYETRRAGEPQGEFTIDSVAQADKLWLGGGQYQTEAQIEARAKARAARKAAPKQTATDEGPPKLRRGPKPGETQAGSSAPPKPDTQTGTAPASTAPASDDDPDRPRLHRPASAETPAPAAPATTATTRTPDDDDPDRPRLHHAPAGEPQTIAPAIKTAPPTAGARPGSPSASTIAAPPAPDVLVAISDAKSSEPRPYVFKWNAEEQTRLTNSALKMANAAIDDFLARQYRIQPQAAAPAPRPTTRTTQRARRAAPPPPPPPAAPAALDAMQVHAFDLEYDNYPEIVLTGQRSVKVPLNESGVSGEEERTVYVALVVKVDVSAADQRDVYRTLLSYVTDDRHLDEFPRLAFLDAVDADGDGIGDLLFSAVDSVAYLQNPQQWGFRLYRIGPDKLQKVYDTAGKLE